MVLHGFFTMGMCICIGTAEISHDTSNNSKYFCKESTKPTSLQVLPRELLNEKLYNSSVVICFVYNFFSYKP